MFLLSCTNIAAFSFTDRETLKDVIEIRIFSLSIPCVVKFRQEFGDTLAHNFRKFRNKNLLKGMIGGIVLDKIGIYRINSGAHRAPPPNIPHVAVDGIPPRVS